MDDQELEEIKRRCAEVRKALGPGSHTQWLIETDFPTLLAGIQRLKDELARAGMCPHGSFYKDQKCVDCFGDGTEEVQECSECGTQTWHRGDKCLRHDMSAPKPYETLKTELEELRSKMKTIQEECSARVAAAEERVVAIQASSAAMREALEYIRPRLGSVNIGESLVKIDRALSISAGNQVFGRKD